jgi:hypothetical protein
MSSIKSIAVENLSDVAVRETARGASLRCETRQRASRCVAEGTKPLNAALAPLKPARQPTNGNRLGRPKMTKTLKFAVTFALMTFMSGFAARSEDAGQETLIKALAGAKISLQQGIAQVAKGTEVPTEAKYEMDKGKLALTVYTSGKGFDTAAEDNSFNEYGGDATAAAWKPDKEVFADLKHIARSAQYHTLLSMTKMTIPAIIQKAAPLGTVFSVKEKIRNGKPVFEVMTAQGGAAKTTYYDLLTGDVAAGM